MAGYGDVYSYKSSVSSPCDQAVLESELLRRHYWIWGAIIAPIAGAVASGGVYHLFLRHPDENHPWVGFFEFSAGHLIDFVGTLTRDQQTWKKSNGDKKLLKL